MSETEANVPSEVIKETPTQEVQDTGKNQRRNQNQNQNQNRQQKKNTYAPRRGPIIDLEPVLNKQVYVKLSGGREVEGKLSGYDQLMNLVIEDATVKTPSYISYFKVDEEIKLQKIVIIGRLLVSLEPMDGYEVISNPNLQLDFVI
ncbi:Sm-like protein lsm7 [Pichia californica]|uniref:Sm-like protein lsm7 n=1 Tax=Pichia californica TaxID=460514 RepID=A0A9P6WMI1_9ASCO|nr:Sm-like protein lsm7 [[Candida] californica]KAG0689802.1 Sm-like protein lsm7 [[Candida] californica]